MKNFVLTRINQNNDFTLGYLTFANNDVVFTLERPWLDNEPFKSCIPLGDYMIQPKKHPRLGDVIEIVHVKGRAGILMHPANEVHELEGCIAPGMGWIKPCLQHSVDAQKKLIAYLDGNPGVLIIKAA